jgi:tetratricopeptide (TPR) repeat protein
MGAAWLLARAAVLDIGLPLWTIPLVVGVSALGVPAILVTWYVQRVARQAVLQTPVRTPGGTPTTRGTVATLALRASPHVSWRGTARVGLATAALLVVSIAAVMVLRLYGLGPAASLMAAGRIGADSRVLVARFAATGTDTSLGAVVAQGFRTSLAQSRAIRLVDAGEVAAGFRRMTLPDSTPLTDPVARELAEREGIPLLVTGTVAPVGAGFLVTASLVRTDSGTVLTSEQGGADAPRELVATIDEIARALRARIGESLRDVARARRLEEATTPSLEALREYTRAVELASVEGRWPEAIRHLRAAVREDTAFASAWRTLSVYLNNLGERRGEVLRAAEQAYRHRDRTDGAERRSIEAGYLRWVDMRGAIQLLASTAEGNETTAYARLLREVGQAARSESVQVAAIARMKAANRPLSNLTYTNVIASRLAQGKVADARHALRQMREEFPTGYFTDAAEVWVGWVGGGPDSLPHLIAQARRSVMPSTWTLAARLEASLAMMRGQHRRVGALIARGEALADSSGTSPDPVSWTMTAILARALHTGDLPRGVRALDSLRRANPEAGMDPADAHLLEFASAFARLGASERGAPLLAEFQRTASRDRRLARLGEVHHAMGDLALARGDAAQALAMYRRAAQTDSGRPADPFSVDWRERMARAFDALGARDSAAAYYDWVAEHRDFRGYVHAGVHLPVVLRRLGLLYREMGDVARARLVTARLLALWRDADPELAPAVADMRTTLTALPR